MSVSPFEVFITPARRAPQLWRILLGCVTILVVFTIALAALLCVMWLVVGSDDDAILWLDRMQGAITPTSTLLLLATFFGLALGPMVAVWLWHRNPGFSLFGPRVWLLTDFIKAAVIVVLILGASLQFWLQFNAPIANQPLNLWLSFLPSRLSGLLIQTGAEELVFRGYLQQHLAARFNSPFAWMILPSLLFGLVHYDPTSAGENVWLVVAAATLFGFCAADLTARTGSLGAAWGFHFANNFMAISIIATDGTITGLSLFLTPYRADEISSTLLMTDMGITVVAWLACRTLIKRKPAETLTSNPKLKPKSPCTCQKADKKIA